MTNKIGENEESMSEYKLLESDQTPYWRKSLYSYVRPFQSRYNFCQSFIGFFPWIEWLSKYSIKNQLPGDFIGGVVGGIMNITKGSAYAQLAGIPPVNGLYALFLASFVYPVFSSWSQGSMCAFAIIQLMCGAAVEQIMQEHQNATEAFELGIEPSTIVSTLTFMNGVMFLIFGLLRLQFLTIHFSKPLISGFLTAAVLHLIMAQIGNVIGIKRTKTRSGFGQFFFDLYELIKLLPQTNIMTLLISIACFVFLLSTKSFLDRPIKKWTKSKRFIVPWELLLVIFVTFAVYVFDLDSNFNVKTVGNVPSGLPNFQPPNLQLIPSLIRHSIAISIVQIAFHISLAKVMCNRKKYEIDVLQEIYAMSGVHLCTGFFPSYPTTNGLGRAMVIDACGATSQICSIVSGAVVLLVLLSAGPLFYWIPLCVLAVIVLISARELLKGFAEFPYYWSKSKWDGSIWLVTFSASISLDIIVGLGVGVVFQLFSIVSRTQWPKWTASVSDEIATLKFHSILTFSNFEVFNQAILETCQIWAIEENKKLLRVLFLDCSPMNVIDTVGLETLIKIGNELESNYNCLLFFVKLEDEFKQKIQFMDPTILDDQFFPDTEKALESAKLQLFKNNRNIRNKDEYLSMI